jgi:hypothetical protein
VKFCNFYWSERSIVHTLLNSSPARRKMSGVCTLSSRKQCCVATAHCVMGLCKKDTDLFKQLFK